MNNARFDLNLTNNSGHRIWNKLEKSSKIRQEKNQALLYLWRLRPEVKHCKVSEYYDLYCLKPFLLFSTLRVMIELWGKSPYFAQKRYLYQNSTTKQS